METSCGLQKKLFMQYQVTTVNQGISDSSLSLSIDQLRLPESREIVLEYIIERKRMDDLSDSIIDRRFHEQKV